MTKPLNKNQKIISFIFLLFIVLVYLLWVYPRHIKTTYKAIEYQIGNSKIEKPVKINIDIVYYNRILSNDTFKGTITINDKKLIANNLSINKSDQILSFIDSSYLTHSYGTIFASKELKSLTICVFNNKGWSSGDGITLSAPCDNRTEAVTISNTLFRGFIVKN